MNLRTCLIIRSALFEPDNIRHGDSIEAVKNWGKIEGLEGHLHTNYRVPNLLNIERNLQRL